MPNDSKIETDSNDNIVLKLASGETVTVKASDVEFDQDLVPETDGDGNVGTPSKSWGAANMEQATIGGVRISRDTDATFYVDEANGSDDNDGTSKSEAFASYERALEGVPRFNDSAGILIEQIGDYSGGVTINHRHFGDQSPTVRGTGIRIVGESRTDGQGGTDPSNIETINGDFVVHGGSGIQLYRLHLNGRVSFFGMPHGIVTNCKLGSDGQIFLRNFGGVLKVNKCGLDPQGQDPLVGIQSVSGGRTVTNNITYQNWDPLANTFLSGIEGIVLDGDMFRGRDYDDTEVSRAGIVFPSTEFALAAPTNDLDLRGRTLPGVGGKLDASTGDIRAANGASIQARNAADDGDFGLTFTSDDELEASAPVVPDAAGTRTVGTAATHFNEMHATDFISHSPEPRDVQAARESLASYTEDGYGSMNVAEMVANLIAVVRTQQQEIEDLRQ